MTYVLWENNRTDWSGLKPNVTKIPMIIRSPRRRYSMGCITNTAWRELPHDAAFQPRRIYLLRRARTLAPNPSNR